MNFQELSGPETPARGSRMMLESWKEIAAYLQRDAKTAQRWEKEEGLPIHRHSHKSRSSVYAYPSEIDAWRVSRKLAAEAPAPPPVSRPLWRLPAFALTVLLCLAMVGNGIRPASAQGRPTAKRLLVATTQVQDYQYYNISQDGQWLGGTDWSQGDLILKGVSSGETKRMVVAADKDNNRWAETPLISPDQKQVAFWWFDSADPNAHGQLRVMPNQPGAKSRVLIGGTEEYTGAGAYPIGWSPDGKRILATLDKLNQNRSAAGAPRRRKNIAWVSAADGSVQVVKTLDPWNAGKGVMVSLSPDGRYIAYSAKIRREAPEIGIFVLSADGSTQTELVRGDVNQDPVWTPDGTHILFSSNRSGAFGLWAVAVREGKREGVPVLLKPDTGTIHAIGMTRSGRYFYRYSGSPNQVLIAAIDSTTGKARGPAAESFVGRWPAFSRDGKWLAFTRLRAGANGNELILHSMGTGMDWATGQIGTGPIWYLDGSVQMNIGRGRMNVSDGQPKETVAPLALPVGHPSPDDKLLYVRRGNEGIDAVDAATGERKQLLTVPGGVIYFALSPDGKTFGIVSATAGILHLSRIDVDGSNYRELAKGVSNGQPAWTRDGRSIYFVQPDGKNSAVARLMRISAEGGQPEFTGISAQGLQDLDSSPDGSKIAYSVEPSDEEVWELDNVLSAIK